MRTQSTYSNPVLCPCSSGQKKSCVGKYFVYAVSTLCISGILLLVNLTSLTHGCIFISCFFYCSFDYWDLYSQLLQISWISTAVAYMELVALSQQHRNTRLHQFEIHSKATNALAKIKTAGSYKEHYSTSVVQVMEHGIRSICQLVLLG